MFKKNFGLNFLKRIEKYKMNQKNWDKKKSVFPKQKYSIFLLHPVEVPNL